MCGENFSEEEDERVEIFIARKKRSAVWNDSRMQSRNFECIFFYANYSKSRRVLREISWLEARPFFLEILSLSKKKRSWMKNECRISLVGEREGQRPRRNFEKITL